MKALKEFVMYFSITFTLVSAVASVIGYFCEVNLHTWPVALGLSIGHMIAQKISHKKQDKLK